MSKQQILERKALLIEQNPNHPIYMFTLASEEILQVADFSRISRDQSGKLIGYQRPEVKRHVKEISDYLNDNEAIFPNSIILALSTKVRFKRSRGPKVNDGHASTGTLEIPLTKGGENKAGWIVDGQQRALALTKSHRKNFPVPVTAFIADEVALQRDQFIRINNVKALPKALVTELLPEVSTPLPPKLAAKKIPSALCDLLNQRKESPFKGLIKRASSSDKARKAAVITDASITNMLSESITSASGCLFPYRNLTTGETDFDEIWAILVEYWGAVQKTFPQAWGKPANQSRLMHGVGIRSMGRLMDKIMPSIDHHQPDASARVCLELHKVEPSCRWTEGAWEEMGGLEWNAIQNVSKHISMLSNFLVRTYVRKKGFSQ